MAASVAVPGHGIPEGVDPSTTAGVRAWVASFGVQAMVDRNYADMLIAEGYETLYSLDFTVKELTEMGDNADDAVPAGRAKRLVRGAQAVMKKLGVFVG